MSDSESFMKLKDPTDPGAELNWRWKMEGVDEIEQNPETHCYEKTYCYENALGQIELKDVLSVIDSILQDREVEA